MNRRPAAPDRFRRGITAILVMLSPVGGVGPLWGGEPEPPCIVVSLSEYTLRLEPGRGMGPARVFPVGVGRMTPRGQAGPLMNVFRPALSSVPRQKSHYKGEEPACRYHSGDSFAINEVVLLLNALAYNIVHAVRVLLASRTHRGWGLQSLRERVLRVPARLVLHARRAVLVITDAAGRLWLSLWAGLASLCYVET